MHFQCDKYVFNNNNNNCMQVYTQHRLPNVILCLTYIYLHVIPDIKKVSPIVGGCLIQCPLRILTEIFFNLNKIYGIHSSLDMIKIS